MLTEESIRDLKNKSLGQEQLETTWMCKNSKPAHDGDDNYDYNECN